MKIALIQIASPDTEAIEHRRRRVAELVYSAGDADLIVLPELWAVGYNSFDRYAKSAEPMDGPTVADAARWAGDLHCWIHAGSFVERISAGSYRNSAVLVAPDGAVAHRYSKVHVFGYESKEAELLLAGDRLSVVKTPYGVMAATTCYDLRFPELWRGLVELGAEVVIVPAAWPSARQEHWRLFTSVRAVEEQVVLIACNAAGVNAGVRLAGHSRVVDPWGVVIAEAGEAEEVLMCEIDPAVVGSVRRQFPVLADRLDSYASLLEGGKD